MKAKLLFETEKGERTLLGTKEFRHNERRDVIIEVLIEEFWDRRLDAASCRPVVEIPDEVD